MRFDHPNLSRMNGKPRRPTDSSLSDRSGRLGCREREVLGVIWKCGSATVQQVAARLSLPLAYTTVMTTLDRLFKKGLLRRTKQDRAFLYSPAVSPGEVENLRARLLIDRFFDDGASSPDVLISCLVDAIGSYDEELLASLEEKVRAAKQRLEDGDRDPISLSRARGGN